MIPLEYTGAPCEIRTLKNVLIATGRIKKIDENYVEIFDPSNGMPVVSYNTTLKIAMHDSDLGFRVLVGDAYISNRQMLRVVNVTNFLEFERRRFFRLDVELEGGLLMRDLITLEDITDPVKIRDISLCGMRFESTRKLHINDEIKLRVLFSGHEARVMNVVVRRWEELKNGVTAYGVEYKGMSAKEEQFLCSFLFERQREQIRKVREKRTRSDWG